MNQGKLNSHFFNSTARNIENSITIKDGRFLTKTMKVDSENNLILKNDLFTYTRRGLLVLSAANFQSLQIRQILCLAKIKQDRCSRCFLSFCPAAAPVSAPRNSRSQSTIHFSATVRLPAAAPVQQNKLKSCLLFHQTRTWLRGSERTFEHKAAYFSFYDCTEKTVSFHPL